MKRERRSDEGVGAGAGSLLSSVLDATADGILVVDGAGAIVVANRRFADLWRIPDHLFAARDTAAMLAFVADQLEDPARFRSKVAELYADPWAESFDVLKFADGRVYERDSRPQIAQGEPVGRVWSFRDVTERERAETALRTSEALYRSLVEQLPAVAWLASGDNTHTIYMSPTVEDILGYTAAEISDLDDWFEMVHPVDRAHYMRETRRCVEAELPYAGTYRALRKDGSVMWLREHEGLVRAPDGSLLYRQGVVFDISTELEAQSTLAHAETLYRGLVEQLPAATYLWEFGGSCVYVSPQIEAVYGCSADEFAGGAWRSIIHPDDVEIVLARVRSAHATGRGTSVEYRIVHAKTGALRTIHETTEVVAAPGRTLVQGLIVDRTENVRARVALDAADADRAQVIASMLRIADDERVRISSELHDDTIQVLTGALLTTDALLADLRAGRPPEQRTARLRELLEVTLERTRRLIFDLDPPLLRTAGVGPAIAELAASAGRDGGFEAVVDIDLPRYPAHFEALLYRTLRELVVNARKHSQCHHLTVTAHSAGDQLSAAVADDGIGYDPANQPSSFADLPLHFGLRSTAERVRLAGGSLTVDSARGRGSRTEIALPAPPPVANTLA